MLVVLFGGARGKEGVGVGGGGSDVRGEHGARDGDVDGEHRWVGAEERDHEVDLGTFAFPSSFTNLGIPTGKPPYIH